MHDCSRLFLYLAVNQESYSEEDERHAEPLSHIEHHILLETYLRFLDELYEETHSETSDEEGSDEESAVEVRQSVLVHKDLEDSEKEVAESLIKLGRMLRLSLSPEFKYESPRKACHITVDLRIEEVAKPDECRCKAHRDGKMVKDPHKIKVILASIMSCKPNHCNKQSDSTSVTCKSSLPRHKDLPEALPAAKIVVRLIEQTVSESGSYDRTDKESIEKRIQKSLRNALPLEEPLEDLPAKDKS